MGSGVLGLDMTSRVSIPLQGCFDVANLLSKAPSLADPVGSSNKCVVDRPSDAGMVKRPTVEIAVSVCPFPVDLPSEIAIRLPGHLYVQERDVAILFLIHSELDAAVKPVEVIQEQLELVLAMLPDDKSVIDIAQPDSRLEISCGDGSLLEFLHEHIG